MLNSPSPFNLAITRIAVFTACLLLAVNGEFLYFASLPRELVFPPAGMAWMANLFPRTALEAQLILAVHVATLAAAILGWHTRVSTVLATVLSVYVLGLPQFFGFVKHYHNVVWFAAILAASPCGDALSLDLRQGRIKRPAPSRAHSIPLFFIALLTGALYFGAGFWKAYFGGFAWIEADSFRHQLFEKWTELEWTPFWRIDREPFLCELMAIFTIVFELTFLPFILFGPTRWLAIIGGLLFHLGAYVFMGIGFWYLAICYVAFVDWRQPKEGVVSASWLQPSAIAGTILLLAVSWANVKQFHSWPIASYPTFAHIFREPIKSNIALKAATPSGETLTRNLESPRLLPRLSSDRHLSLIRAILNQRPSPERNARLRAFLCQGVAERGLPSGLSDLRFEQFVRSTIPEDWSAPPRRILPIDSFGRFDSLSCP